MGWKSEIRDMVPPPPTPICRISKVVMRCPPPFPPKTVQKSFVDFDFDFDFFPKHLGMPFCFFFFWYALFKSFEAERSGKRE